MAFTFSYRIKVLAERSDPELIDTVVYHFGLLEGNAANHILIKRGYAQGEINIAVKQRQIKLLNVGELPVHYPTKLIEELVERLEEEAVSYGTVD